MSKAVASARHDDSLNRSVLFLARTAVGEKKLLLDRFEFDREEISRHPDFVERLAESLTIRWWLTADEFETLISEQYAAASEYIYSHPIWEAIRKGSVTAVRSYLLETRHYLAAAASRMSPSVQGGFRSAPVALLLSQHLVEEWDHAKFFSAALEEMGCLAPLTNAARPLPATLEWIHVTRAIAASSGLSAAACSGLLEYSSTETAAVRAWHAMLSDTGLLPRKASESIREHVETDIGFGHSQNWKKALRAHGPISPNGAAAVLNDVATIAEAIYRWLTSLTGGFSAAIVSAIQLASESRGKSAMLGNPDTCHVAAFHGTPAWPSEFMKAADTGDLAGGAARVICAGIFAMGHQYALVAPSALEATIRDFSRHLAPSRDVDLKVASDILSHMDDWIRSVDGHELWQTMAESPSDELAIGYALESYHYLASAPRHLSSAISSCPHSGIRRLLIAHLEKALSRRDVLGVGLRSAGVGNFAELRPLSSTQAFVGFLELMAREDWRAYLLASTFLQRSLSARGSLNRRDLFYAKVGEMNHVARRLLSAAAAHEIDCDIHTDDEAAPHRLALLLEASSVAEDSFHLAAVAPALAWSFLNGIVQHYGVDAAPHAQRTGWSSGGTC